MRGALPPFCARDEEAWRALLEQHAREEGFACAGGGLAGTLLTLFASMLADTSLRLNRAPEKQRRVFLNCVRTARLPARSAQTAVAFDLAEGYGQPVFLPAGTLLCAERRDGGPPVFYAVKHDFLVLPIHLREIWWTDRRNDTVQCARRTGDLHPFVPWSGAGGGTHRLDMTFRSIFCNAGGLCTVRMTAEGSLEPLADQTAFRWKLLAGEASREVRASAQPDGSLQLELERFPVTEPAAVLRLELRDRRFLGLELRALRLSARRGEIKPDMVLLGDRRLDPDGFYPFGSPLESCAACHIFCNEALYRPGAVVTLTFDLELEVLEERLPEEPESVDFRWIMRRPRPKPEPAVYDAWAADVRWEYWNGAAYCPLPADIRPDTRFARPEKEVTLTFPCPRDIALRELGEYSGYCIRLSCGICGALYQMPRRVHTPRIGHLRLAYRMDASCGPERAEAENFGERTALENPACMSPFSPPRCPPGTDRALYLGLDGVPPGGRLRILFCFETFSDPARDAACWMESASGPIPLALYDETRGLTGTGILTCIAPEHPEQTVLFGRKRYWLCITPPPEAAAPRITAVCVNAQRVWNRAAHTAEVETSQLPRNREVVLAPNVVEARVEMIYSEDGAGGRRREVWKEQAPGDRKFACGTYRIDYARGILTLPEEARTPRGDRGARLCVRYEVSDGAEGNVPAGAISRMYDEIPFITRVYNPMAAVDGSAGESDEDMAERVEHLLYCGGRAVTERDYELLAVDCCPLVKKAKCAADGTLKLAVLLAAEQRQAFPQVRVDLELLFNKMGCGQMYGQRTQIIHAEPVPIDCWLVIVDSPDVGTLASGLHKGLAEYTDPVTGGPDGTGWEIGAMPDELQLRAKTAELLQQTGVDLKIERFSMKLGKTPPGIFCVPGELRLHIGGQYDTASETGHEVV